MLQQYHRISLIVSSRSRRVVNPARGGGYTARCILSHGQGVLSRDDAACREVYKHIARVAHPDRNPVRDAYHCAVAGIVMDIVQRASDIVASSSSSDRDAFHLPPALDSAQFMATVDAHRLAKVGHTPPPAIAHHPSGSGLGHTGARRWPSLIRTTHSIPSLARLCRSTLT